MNKHIGYCGALFVCVLMSAACAPKNVSFSADVQPILKQYCLECHEPGGSGFGASGFDISSYETLMKGGKFGALVIPGDPLTSTLNILVEGRAHPSIHMPHGRKKLSDRETEILRDWVQEGAKNN